MADKIRGRLNELTLTKSGTVSMTKFWANVGCLTATFVIVWRTVHDKIEWPEFLAYLSTVGGFAQVSKWLTYRSTGAPAPAPSAEGNDEAAAAPGKCKDCPTSSTGTTAGSGRS